MIHRGRLRSSLFHALFRDPNHLDALRGTTGVATMISFLCSEHAARKEECTQAEAAETAEVDWEEVVREAAAEVAMGEAAEEVAMVKVEALMEQARD